MSSSIESFNIVNFIENLLKNKFLIIINLFIFMAITFFGVHLLNTNKSTFSYNLEISESKRFDYRISNSFGSTLESLFITKESILFDIIASLKSSDNLEQFISYYSNNKLNKMISIDDQNNLFDIYSGSIKIKLDKDENIYTVLLNINKYIEDQIPIDNSQFFVEYVEYSIDKSFTNIISAISARLVFIEQTYNSNLKIESERINKIKESYSKFSQTLLENNRLEIENTKRVLRYQIEVARAKEAALLKVMENKIISNIKIAKKLGYAKPLTSESINTAIYGDASQNILTQSAEVESLKGLNNQLTNTIPLYVFGYELLEEELDHLLKTKIDDSLNIKQYSIELDNISDTDHIAFVKRSKDISNSLNDEIESSIRYQANLKKDYDTEYELTNRLLNYFKSISLNNSASRNLIINFNKYSLEKKTFHLNIFRYLVLSIFISVLFSLLIIYYRVEKIKNKNY